MGDAGPGVAVAQVEQGARSLPPTVRSKRRAPIRPSPVCWKTKKSTCRAAMCDIPDHTCRRWRAPSTRISSGWVRHRLRQALRLGVGARYVKGLVDSIGVRIDGQRPEYAREAEAQPQRSGASAHRARRASGRLNDYGAQPLFHHQSTCFSFGMGSRHRNRADANHTFHRHSL